MYALVVETDQYASGDFVGQLQRNALTLAEQQQQDFAPPPADSQPSYCPP
jgi:hypothetical protein